jgi:hypothetical protein
MEPAQETGNFIASEKVEGTNVYNPAGDNLGSIHDLMIDKASGKVAYALMSFDGFLGIGKRYHPLPWSLLNYDTKLAGYVVNLDKRRLKARLHTTSARNQRGAIALTKAKFMTITKSLLTGPSDISTRTQRLQLHFWA